MTLSVADSGSFSSSTFEYQVPLDSMSTQWGVTHADATEPYELRSLSRDGLDVVRVRFSMTINGKQDPARENTMFYVRLRVGERASADSLAKLATAAVTECGGTATTDRAQARLAAFESENAAVVASFARGGLSQDAFDRVYAVCKGEASKPLTAPESAQFNEPFARPKPTDRTFTLVGRVSSVNAFNVRSEAQFACVFDDRDGLLVFKSLFINGQKR